MSFKSTLSNRGSIAGIAFGALYGLVARALVSANSELFPTMTLGFLFLVPVVVGYLAVRPARQPSERYKFFFPWIPCLLILLVAALVGWEGSICLFMGSPILFVMGSVGGLLGGRAALRSRAGMAAVLLAPWVVMPLDSKLPLPREIREVRTEIVIAAPAQVVWRNIVQVREIRPDEHRPALFTAMGFPRPLSATLDREGVGGLRHARFEKGVLFLETVTEWQEERRLAFTIDAQTESIPATTLDPHVTIGGPFFDVLTGTYTIEPLPGGKIRLHLASRHRVSTRFNVYSGLWADAIMRSIQNNILEVIRRRCEAEAGAPPESGYTQVQTFLQFRGTLFAVGPRRSDEKNSALFFTRSHPALREPCGRVSSVDRPRNAAPSVRVVLRDRGCVQRLPQQQRFKSPLHLYERNVGLLLG